ncbi:hypothetical protein ACFC26_17230 [Kitasatospora purpeofusca]|uniref:DNA polymerase Y family protein n=1 Tax=Kitasatospora purpeofusca TaxID=67352 RepID=UPI0035D85667
MSSATLGAATVLHVQLHPPTPGHLDALSYELLLDLLRGVTPLVQPQPPDEAVLEVAGALGYFDTTPAGICALIRARSLALYGVDTSIGAAANPLLARLAAAALPPGRTLVLHPGEVPAFLAPLPPIALPGIGPTAARTLAQLGLTTLDRIATTPATTLQRALGAAAGRRLADQARGIDLSPVVPGRLEQSLAAEHAFPYDELDSERQRAVLLALAHDLGAALRGRGEVAAALTLTVRYADRSTTTRTRRLTEPTAHGPALVEVLYRIHQGLGLQRARVRHLALRAGELRPASGAPRQLTFDGGADRSRLHEAAADRARARFGPQAITQAALLPVPDGPRVRASDARPG